MPFQRHVRKPRPVLRRGRGASVTVCIGRSCFAGAASARLRASVTVCIWRSWCVGAASARLRVRAIPRISRTWCARATSAQLRAFEGSEKVHRHARPWIQAHELGCRLRGRVPGVAHWCQHRHSPGVAPLLQEVARAHGKDLTALTGAFANI